MKYQKYLPITEKDTEWGLSIHNAGYTFIPKLTTYPNVDHPTNYYFKWDNGRVLQEYQIIYITQGKGLFESDHGGIRSIEEGTIILLFPNEKHRYKPNSDTGWHEYWIGLSGSFLDNLITNGFFSPDNPVLTIGLKENIFSLLQDIVEITKHEKPGYQQLISGAAIHLLGIIYSEIAKAPFTGKDHLSITIEKACVLFREYMTHPISPEDISNKLQVGYSWFRHAFKEYTGMAPNQYLIQLKIQKSKELLLIHENSIKSVTHQLNFNSVAYFSKLFKNRTGLTPNDFRTQGLRPQEYKRTI